MTPCSELNRLIAISKAWSVREALWVLEVYDCSRDELCWHGSWITPYTLGLATDSERPALAIAVKFLGGPNGGREFTGPFSMYVIDRVLENWKLTKTSWYWLLHFNSNTTTPIKEQLELRKPNSLPRQKFLQGLGTDKSLDHCANLLVP